MTGYTAFPVRHACGEPLLYDDRVVYACIATVDGLTSSVSLRVDDGRPQAPEVPADALLTCSCGKLRTGRELDRDAILGLEREKITAVICQTDRSGAGSGIRRIRGEDWIVGVNGRGEGLALVWNGTTGSRVTSAIINEALSESKRLGLKTPLRIYGTTCAVSETRSFRFCQIPDEILASLASSEPVEDDLADLDPVETTAGIP